MLEGDYLIRTALTTDRPRLANLIHFGSYIHQHLDWKPPLDWIGTKPYLLVEKKDNILATLACPPDVPEMTWIRLFAVNSPISVERAWKLLWPKARTQLINMGKINIAAISLQGWFNDLLESSGYKHTDDVMVLQWEGTTFPSPKNTNLYVRAMQTSDLKTIEAIDHQAFGNVWKNSLEALELAYQQSSLASVVECDREVVGYQYSTVGAMGGHLARLAVKPTMQRKGLGYLLVHHVLTYFRNQGIKRVTVNTQQNNPASLALYTRIGFSHTGESYHVYQYCFEE